MNTGSLSQVNGDRRRYRFPQPAPLQTLESFDCTIEGSLGRSFCAEMTQGEGGEVLGMTFTGDDVLQHCPSTLAIIGSRILSGGAVRQEVRMASFLGVLQVIVEIRSQRYPQLEPSC